MKKIFLSIFFFSLVVFKSIAQKPSIDIGILGKWPSVEHPSLSNDGNYALFYINNKPIGNKTLIVKSTKNAWEKEIVSVSRTSATFDRQSQVVVFMKADSLQILKLGSPSIEKIPHVADFKLFQSSLHDFLSYLLETPNNTLVIRDLSGGTQLTFDNVVDYWINDDVNLLTIKHEVKSKNGSIQRLDRVNLHSRKVYPIYTTSNINQVLIDESGKKIAFTTVSESKSDSGKRIMYYEEGMDSVICLSCKIKAEFESVIEVDGLERFTRDGTAIIFNSREISERKRSDLAVMVDVWSFSDTRLQSEQLIEVNKPALYKYKINITPIKVMRLEFENETLQFQSVKKSTDSLVLLRKTLGNGTEAELSWNVSSRASYNLLSISSGKRIVLPCSIGTDAKMSPRGKYIIYFDSKEGNYFTYNVSSGKIVNITREIKTEWTIHSDEDVDSNSIDMRSNYPICGWFDNDERVILMDKYDIWQVDPSGQKQAVNITNGYGRSKKIIFRIVEPEIGDIIDSKGELLLSAFSESTYENGYFKKKVDKKGDPKLLVWGDYMYYAPENSDSRGSPPIRSKNGKGYIIKRMTSKESPNYFFTEDFKSFKRLSDVYPERMYNWLTTELATWSALDGRICRGILYKPEDFDSTKKYPVIFNYYIKKSHLINEYLTPNLSEGDMNIPWFVSQGYIVFTPDMHNVIGKPRESILNVIVSGANYLRTKPWIDNRRMGIQGFSYGGFETNILVTNTDIFAAAVSGAGPSNLISFHGGLFNNGNGPSIQQFVEIGEINLGSAPWQNPEKYIENSPIFGVDKVTTPLLMLGNKNDGGVSFSQAIEFFTALRRLGKPAWLLQYDGGSHGVWNRDALDYTIRITQFFDHYLKGLNAAKWMLDGIPAKLKGIYAGLEIDTLGRTPASRLLIDHSQKCK